MSEASQASLIERFRRAALEKGSGVGGRRDAALHRELADCVRELESGGVAGRDALRSLLADARPEVRGWVAAHLLATGATEARRVLEQDRHLPGIVGLNASMVLEEYRAGRLQTPFPPNGV